MSGTCFAAALLLSHILKPLPNLLSIFRLLATPALIALIVRGRFEAALILGFAAGLSDLLDGYLARWLRSTSQLGAYLDPAADKAMLVSGFVSLGVVGQIPLWLVALVIARDVVILVGTFLLWRLRNRTEFTPLFSGKISTAFQILTILVVLLGNVFDTNLFPPVRTVVVFATALFTFLSGVNYVRKGIRMSSPTYS